MNICKGHVYIIFCHVNPKIYYVGSTFNQLKQRWNCHKKTNSDCSISKYFDEYGIENFSIKLIKSYNVYREHSKDRKHLEAYELLWINKLKGCCNELIPFNPLPKLSKQIYRQDNKEKILEQKKNYYKDNKEQILEKNKEHYEDNKEKILEKNKQYRQDNKEKIKQQKKEYYQDNIEKHKEKAKEKYTCECGTTFGIYKKNRHYKSKKHQDYIKNNINNI